MLLQYKWKLHYSRQYRGQCHRRDITRETAGLYALFLLTICEYQPKKRIQSSLNCEIRGFSVIWFRNFRGNMLKILHKEASMNICNWFRNWDCHLFILGIAYFMIISVACLFEWLLHDTRFVGFVVSNGRTIQEKWTGKELKGSGNGLNKVLFRYLTGRAEENY
jgi:hypothetical protein